MLAFGLVLHSLGNWTVGYWTGANTVKKVLTGDATPWKDSKLKIITGWITLLVGMSVLLHIFFTLYKLVKV